MAQSNDGREKERARFCDASRARANCRSSADTRTLQLEPQRRRRQLMQTADCPGEPSLSEPLSSRAPRGVYWAHWRRRPLNEQPVSLAAAAAAHRLSQRRALLPHEGPPLATVWRAKSNWAAQTSAKLARSERQVKQLTSRRRSLGGQLSLQKTLFQFWSRCYLIALVVARSADAPSHRCMQILCVGRSPESAHFGVRFLLLTHCALCLHTATRAAECNAARLLSGAPASSWRSSSALD